MKRLFLAAWLLLCAPLEAHEVISSPVSRPPATADLTTDCGDGDLTVASGGGLVCSGDNDEKILISGSGSGSDPYVHVTYTHTAIGTGGSVGMRVLNENSGVGTTTDSDYGLLVALTKNGTGTSGVGTAVQGNPITVSGTNSALWGVRGNVSIVGGTVTNNSVGVIGQCDSFVGGNTAACIALAAANGAGSVGIAKRVGIAISQQTGASTANVNFLSGTQSAGSIPDGSWNIYAHGTRTNYFGGPVVGADRIQPGPSAATCDATTEGSMRVTAAVAGVSATVRECCEGTSADPVVYSWGACS